MIQNEISLVIQNIIYNSKGKVQCTESRIEDRFLMVYDPGFLGYKFTTLKR